MIHGRANHGLKDAIPCLFITATPRPRSPTPTHLPLLSRQSRAIRPSSNLLLVILHPDNPLKYIPAVQ